MVRRWGAAALVAVGLGAASPARSQDATPDKPRDCANRWGVHRDLVVSTQAGPAGLISYKKTLPLGPREVALTFDDGPMPGKTPAVLDALQAECAKATFFVVGSMATASPGILRRTAEEGHTIATHTWSHAYLNRVRADQRRRDQIHGGLQAASAILGEDAPTLSPFFRFPGLGRTRALDGYVASRHLISLSADVVGDDWRKISSDDVLRRVMSRLEARGSGVLLLHDIQPRTVAMLPELLRRLREGGWKLVHLRPAPGETQLALSAAPALENRRMIAAIDVVRTKTVAENGFRVVLAHKATPSFESLGLRR
jgi:peptidoglycan/xylan/chitin deacetylase (PgdA/CDA1 family)